MDDIVIRPADIRRFGVCAAGSRRFCARHAIDWRQFIKHGLPASVIEATGDPMALDFLRKVRADGR